jgi:AcrR family transcriptional regulator
VAPGAEGTAETASETAGRGHEARRAAVLAAAAREFNARGIGRASFARIARELGITRAALYYYVKDRQDLVRQCYAQSCAAMAADLAAAERAPGTALARVLAFVRASLDPERAPLAVLSELDYLTGLPRAEIAAAHEANISRLRALIRAGDADASLRPCDDEVIAQGLTGVIAWVPLSVDWLEGVDPTYRPRTVEALSNLITDGIAADPTLSFTPPVSARAFLAPPPAAFDRQAQSDAKIEQILAAASAIFNRRGVDGASLDEIAAALGATKGAFYHYLDNRQELLAGCYRRAFGLFEGFADAAERLGRNGLETGMIGLWLNVQAHALGLAPLVQMVGVESLPPATRAEIRRRSRALQQRYAAASERAVAEGATRVGVDSDALAQFSAGVFEWLPTWFDLADPRAETALAQEYVDLFIRGLRRR